MLFPTTIAGSLPKPEWLAEPNVLWAPWKSSGAELERAKRDATMLAVKLQEDAGVDIVTEGEQARQHLCMAFSPTSKARFRPQGRDGNPQRPLQGDGAAGGGAAEAEGRVHADEARIARTHTARQLKFTLPGPMTIIDTIADQYTATASRWRSRLPNCSTRRPRRCRPMAST